MPEALKPLVLQYYPAYLRRLVLKDTYCHPSVPIEQDVNNGLIQSFKGNITPQGPTIYLVTYDRCSTGNLVYIRAFRQEANGTFSYLPMTGCGTDERADPADQDPNSEDWRPQFQDIDGDGTNEILLYNAARHLWGTSDGYESVAVFAYRNGGLVCITPFATFTASSVGFADLDNDGKMELTVNPDYDSGWTWDTAPDGTQSEYKYSNVTSGTKIYKLQNGIYTLLMETPVGTSAITAMPAAMRPASWEESELKGEHKVSQDKVSKDEDEAVTLTICPPATYTLDDVDWTTLRAADFKVAPTADLGNKPAPFPPGSTTTWMPMDIQGRTMLLEDLQPKDQGKFDQKTGDPCLYEMAKGRLHMTAPYREVRFPKQSLRAWLYQSWQTGGARTDSKVCIKESDHAPEKGNALAPASAKKDGGGEEHCFVPISLPIKATLKNNRGYAIGGATLWIKLKGDSATVKLPEKACPPAAAAIPPPSPGQGLKKE